MKKKLLQSIGLIFSLSLLIAALLVIHYELKEYDIQDIFYRLKRLQSLSLFLAVILTILSYSLMTVYDTLALRYIHHPLKYGRTAIASFISYSISNNMGLLILSGAPVRYRLYSAWGLTAVEIAKVVVFCSLSLWAGFFTLGGSVFLIEPLIIPSTVSSRFTSVRAIGIIFLLLSAGYIMLSVFRKRPLKIGKWEFPLIPLKLSLSQITVSSLDWALVGGVLYVLLPPHPGLSYPGFMGIFMLAQFLGIISNVPGGLGVFESVVIILLSPVMEPSTILGSLLAFRGIYYILPLIVSSVLLATFEIVQRKEGVKKTFRVFSRLITVLTPHVLTFTTFMGGIILLVSGATPALGSRLAWLRDFVPLPVVEISHFLGSLAGAGLIMLAQGLQRRLDAAYILTLILLGMGALFSLLKGLDYEEASILLVMFCALLASRRHFYRKASLIGQRFTPGWTAAISAVLICTAWLGIFSYKHIEYSNNLWWQFTFAGDAPRFLRATVGAVVVILVISTAKLLRPVTPEFSLPASSDLEKIHSITAESRNTSANLAFLGDKSLLFSGSGNSFIMYGVEGRSWIAMGDPIGPNEETAELAWRFREMCDRHDGWTVFYEVGTENLQVYLDL
ncbi:MAG TPA: lysylphosphatidylglycerol synthetase family protein, partial [Nitrospirae bacterium]|nr:lysylphosphatidylglycerol synthetase family protein [Nitrospirota bacterium]